MIKWVIMPAVFYYERENNLVCLLVMIISTSLVMLGCIQASTLHRVFVSYYLSNDSAVDVCVRHQTVLIQNERVSSDNQIMMM